MAFAATASASFPARSGFWSNVYRVLVAYGQRRAEVALRTHAI